MASSNLIFTSLSATAGGQSTATRTARLCTTSWLSPLTVHTSGDGWRKKYCGDGAALNDIMALTADRAYFQ